MDQMYKIVPCILISTSICLHLSSINRDNKNVSVAYEFIFSQEETFEKIIIYKNIANNYVLSVCKLQTA